MIETSCVVRARDFAQPWFAERAAELNERFNLHRKLWEFCTIIQVFQEQALIGSKVLGFGVGLEPLPSWFAARGADVMATDKPGDDENWDDTGQHAKSLLQLHRPAICTEKVFRDSVRFQPVDMLKIPPSLLRSSYDMTWSAGSFEHLGSLEKSIDFFCRQMECLRPGGLAVHTTEYNADEDGPTLSEGNIVLFQKKRLIQLQERLEEQGDHLWPLDLTPGNGPADLFVDTPPWGLPHLRLSLGPYVITSILLVAQRGERA